MNDPETAPHRRLQAATSYLAEHEAEPDASSAVRSADLRTIINIVDGQFRRH